MHRVSGWSLFRPSLHVLEDEVPLMSPTELAPLSSWLEKVRLESRLRSDSLASCSAELLPSEAELLLSEAELSSSHVSEKQPSTEVQVKESDEG